MKELLVPEKQVADYLTKESSIVFDRKIVLSGYKLFSNKEWLLDRSRLQKTLILQSTDEVVFYVLQVDGEPKHLVDLFAEYERNGTKALETPQGTIMINKDSGNAQPIPSGDYETSSMLWICQCNLYQFGVLVEPKCQLLNPATEQQFYQTLKIELSRPVPELLHNLVYLTQQALYFFDMYHKDLDGICCSDTMNALEQFYFEYGPFGGFAKNKKPWADLMMIYNVLDTLDGYKKKLTSLGFSAPKNLQRTDPNVVRKQIKAFQRSNNIPLTMKLDKETAGRIQSQVGSRRKSTFTNNLRHQINEFTGLGQNLELKAKKDEQREQSLVLNQLLNRIMEEGDAYRLPIYSEESNRRLPLTKSPMMDSIPNIRIIPEDMQPEQFLQDINGLISDQLNKQTAHVGKLVNDTKKALQNIIPLQEHPRRPSAAFSKASDISAEPLSMLTMQVVDSPEQSQIEIFQPLLKSKSTTNLRSALKETRRASWSGFEIEKWSQNFKTLPPPQLLDLQKAIDQIEHIAQTETETVKQLKELVAISEDYQQALLDLKEEQERIKKLEQKHLQKRQILFQTMSDTLAGTHGVQYKMDALDQQLQEYDSLFHTMSSRIKKNALL
ncbi:hypothetical protein EDD86DRAFT_202248 [Gorgonomyces haynaldii]|nr:hypothetical protein EDD86DRAFT_202248 [Gorgonomyces haynaldii]